MISSSTLALRHRNSSISRCCDDPLNVIFALGPRGRIEALAAQGLERGLLRILENDQGALAGGAMDALACGLEAPAARLALDVVAIDPLLAAEEALPQILDPALDVGFALGVAGHGGIDHEAAMAGVLGEGALEDRVATVRLRDRGLEVVEHDSAWDTSEEVPGVLQTLDQVLDLLGRE